MILYIYQGSTFLGSRNQGNPGKSYIYKNYISRYISTYWGNATLVAIPYLRHSCSTRSVLRIQINHMLLAPPPPVLLPTAVLGVLIIRKIYRKRDTDNSANRYTWVQSTSRRSRLPRRPQLKELLIRADAYCL